MKKKKETPEINSLLTEIKELKKRVKELEKAAAPKAASDGAAPFSASSPKDTYSSDFLQIIIDSIPAPLFFKNAKGVYKLCNSAFENYLGLSRDEIIGKTVYEVAPRELAENYNNMDRELLENGGVQIYEARVRFYDRSVHEVIFNKTCVYGRDGKIIGLIGIMLDISERKKAEAELLKSEELYRALAESSSDMIYVVDYDGKILFVNESAAANLGVNARDAVGKYQQDFFKEDIAKRQLSIIQNVYKTATAFRSYEQKTFFGGREAWIDALLTPIKNGNGEVISVLGVSRDISERKRMQEDILKASKLESLGILAGGIAHDFNNALMAIIGNIILARNRAGDNNKLHEILSRAETVTCKAKNLTKQFITFSGGGAPIKAPCHDIYSLIKELARFVLGGSETVYTVEKNGEIPAVNIDEGQISHALTNIIINARQAVKNNGQIKIGLSCETVADNPAEALRGGRYVKISIADNGHGVPKEIQHKIFDPYFTTKSEGSGLGLSASYSIIKSHGGLIDFSTNENEGSVFNVYIPANGVTAEKAAPAKRDARRTNNKEKILVMDDDESVLTPLCEILTELGYNVRTAANFEQAVDIFNSEFNSGSGFDAAILDLIIKGGIDGVETLNRLKKIDPLIKAIISSGYTHGPVISNFVDYGFDAVLTKPYQKADILNALAGLFGE